MSTPSRETPSRTTCAPAQWVGLAEVPPRAECTAALARVEGSVQAEEEVWAAHKKAMAAWEGFAADGGRHAGEPRPLADGWGGSRGLATSCDRDCGATQNTRQGTRVRAISPH